MSPEVMNKLRIIEDCGRNSQMKLKGGNGRSPSRRTALGLGGCNGQLCGFPSRDAAGEFADGGESAALQKTGGDGGAVAPCAIDKQRAVVRQGFKILHHLIEGHADAVLDVLLSALARRANIDGEGRLVRR